MPYPIEMQYMESRQKPRVACKSLNRRCEIRRPGDIRVCVGSTANKMLECFEPLSTYTLIEDDRVVEESKDDLTDTQELLLRYLGISEREY